MLDQYLVGVTCTLPTMRDQITTPTQDLVGPTKLLLDTLTAKTRQSGSLQGATISLQQKLKYYIFFETLLILAL